MLSIIISSHQPAFYNALSSNISATCGVQHEIIKVENNGKMGICQAYNQGAATAQFPFLLFLHEDVLFHTENWGQILINHLQIPGCGLVGLAGSCYVPYAPWGWHLDRHPYNFLNILQNNKQKDNPRRLFVNLKNEPQPAFALDGVFLGTRKDAFDAIKFPHYLPGFHGYDKGLSLAFARHYTNYVIPDILLEHFSEGNDDHHFFLANIEVKKRSQKKFIQTFDEELEFDTLAAFLHRFVSYYGVNWKLMGTLRFIHPSFSAANKYKILKKYLNYFTHRHLWNQRARV